MEDLKMYVVTREGTKLPVDCSNIPDGERIFFQSNVGLYTEDTILIPIWVVQIQKTGQTFRYKTELELVKEVVYDHEPTQEEILYCMSAYGASRWDIVTILNGYRLDIDVED